MASMPLDQNRRITFTSYVAPSMNSYAAVGVDAASADEWCLPGPIRDVYLAQPRLLTNELVAVSAPAYLCTQLDTAKEGIFGLLSVTNFKLAFVPWAAPSSNSSSPAHLQDSYQEHNFLEHYEVTLNNIDQIYQLPVESGGSGRAALYAVGVVNSSKRKLIDGPQQKLISGRIAGLHIVCKNFRMFKFTFPLQNPSASGVRADDGFKIAQALAKFAFPTRHELSFAFAYREPYYSTTRGTVTMYATKNDWARELIRCGASEWQVVSTENLAKQPEKSAGKATPIHTLPPHFVIPKDCMVERFLDLSRAFCDSRAAFWVYSYGSGGAALVRLAELKSLSEIRDTKVENVMLELVRGKNEKRALNLLPLTDCMPSIQNIQRAYIKFRRLFTPESPQQFALYDAKFLSLLEKSNWLFYVSLCLRYSNEAAETLRLGSTCVLQESRGRDLCCVVSSLTQILLDPYFRTIDGFQSLIQKEWVALEHPFQTRLGHVRSLDSSTTSSSSASYSSMSSSSYTTSGTSSSFSVTQPGMQSSGNLNRGNEVEPEGESPVFLLFLDSVWQLLQQFPEEFEFSQTYLTSLWDACFLPLFDTFQFDTQMSRQKAVEERKLVLRPVWDWNEQFSEKDKVFFTNPLYQKQRQDAGNSHMRRSVALPSSAIMLPGMASPNIKLSSAASSQQQQHRNTINPSMFTPQSSIPKDRFLVPHHRVSYLGIWEQCYYRWLPALEIKHGGSPQIDLYHRLLLGNIAKLQRSIELQDFEDLPDVYYEITGEDKPENSDKPRRNSIEYVDGVQRRQKTQFNGAAAVVNSGSLLPAISSFFPFSISSEENSDDQHLNDILSSSTEFQLEGSIMERLSIA